MRGAPDAVFLDRDGTLVHERDYLSSPEQLELLPGAAEAVARLNAAGVKVVVVTNQSGVARGLFDEAELARIHARLDELLAERGARLDATYYCPHHPTEGHGAYRRECDCRKPSPGLLLRAARELGLDLATCYVVGDSERDLEAGERIGVHGILVATGKGADQYAAMQSAGREPRSYVPDLAEAVGAILG